MKDEMVITRKIKLFPIGDKEEVDRVYTYIRDAQYAQYQCLNLLMGHLASEFYRNGKDLNNPIFKEKQEELLKSKNPILDEIECPKGLAIKSRAAWIVRQDFSTSIKNGLAKGDRTITNYKRSYPLQTPSKLYSFYHPYTDNDELKEKIYDRDLEIYMKWVNKIHFKVILGNPHKSRILRDEFFKILSGEYKPCGSSIYIEKNNIMMNLCLKISKKTLELDEQTVVGVALGITTPAVCATNNSSNELSIGTADDFFFMRKKIEAQRKRLQSALQFTAGGHGREKKLQALSRLKKKEKNFAKTYNHTVTKKIVDFAVKNKAKYIYIEDLTKENTDAIMLRYSGFYQIQEQLKYKADKVGIKLLFTPIQEGRTDIERAKKIALCETVKKKASS